MERFAKMFSDGYLKPLTILAKRSILDDWVGQECASASEYKAVLQIETEISSRKQVKMTLL